MKKTNIYYDLEATNVAREADPISIGLVAVTTTEERVEDKEEAIRIIESITGEEFTEDYREQFNFNIEGENETPYRSRLENNTLDAFLFDLFDQNEGWSIYESLIYSKEDISNFSENWGFYASKEQVFKIKDKTYIFNYKNYTQHPSSGAMGNIKLSITRINSEIKTLYAEFNDFNTEKCDDWIKENIISKLYLDYLKPILISDVPINGVDDVTDENNIKLLGTTSHISKHLKEWLTQFDKPKFYADYDVIDKPMLIDLISDWDEKKDYTLHNKVYEECKEVIETIAYHNSDKTLVDDFISFYPPKTEFIKYNKIGLPKHLPNINYYDFYDLHTMFLIKGIDPDCNRVNFIGDAIKDIPEGSSHNALYDAYINWKVYEKLTRLS